MGADIATHETASESTYRRIRTDIIFGRLAPGEKLRLEKLRGVYDTSVSTLRAPQTKIAPGRRPKKARTRSAISWMSGL